MTLVSNGRRTPFTRPRCKVTVGRSMIKLPSTTGTNVYVSIKFWNPMSVSAASKDEADTERRHARLSCDCVQLARYEKIQQRAKDEPP